MYIMLNNVSKTVAYMQYCLLPQLINANYHRRYSRWWVSQI